MSTTITGISVANISLEIDYREHDLIRLVEEDETFGKNVRHETKNMDVGDIILYVNEQPIYVVERKSISDLNSSVKDGRYREQKARLKKYNRDNPSVRSIIYLLEGHNVGRYKMPVPLYYGVVFNSVIRDGIVIYHTNDISDTKTWLTYLIKKMVEHWKLINVYSESNGGTERGTELSDGRSYLDSISVKKRDNLTPELCYIQQLCQYQGISPTIASRICEKHKTMVELIQHYNECDIERKRENMLCDIEGIGKVLSKRVYIMLFANSTQTN
jgi:crossover junction endonuclease MUS81